MAELMNLIRMGARALYSDGELSDRDYHLLMDTAESILREHEGEWYGVRKLES